jgi:hypothetical protein
LPCLVARAKRSQTLDQLPTSDQPKEAGTTLASSVFSITA